MNDNTHHSNDPARSAGPRHPNLNHPTGILSTHEEQFSDHHDLNMTINDTMTTATEVVQQSASLQNDLSSAATCNEQLRTIWNDIQQPHWNVQRFTDNVTSLLQQYHGNIIDSNDDEYRNTLLSRLCTKTVLPDQDQYDAILFMLRNGADPDRGRVLYWVVLRYYQNKCTEYEFQVLFRHIIEYYKANVNYGTKYVPPFMLDVTCDFSGEIDNFRSWCNRFNVVLTEFLHHGGDINSQNLPDDHETLLSFFMPYGLLLT
jgi:hypothetical protein